jgi:hypothetical protein
VSPDRPHQIKRRRPVGFASIRPKSVSQGPPPPAKGTEILPGKLAEISMLEIEVGLLGSIVNDPVIKPPLKVTASTSYVTAFAAVVAARMMAAAKKSLAFILSAPLVSHAPLH